MDNRTAGKIKWPVDTCENCGHDLTRTVPTARDKALASDGSGTLKWADFCPKCGRGHIVGDRVIPTARSLSVKVISSQAEILSTSPGHRKAPAPAPEETESEDTTGVTSSAENTFDPGKTHEPHRATKPGEYFCTKCVLIHRDSSKVGARHLKNKEA